MSDPWIQTFPSHGPLDLLDPRSEQVDPRDLAWHLSQVNRFTGGTRLPYSVAEHCVRVSWAIERDEGVAAQPFEARTQTCLAGLLHDAAEAYVGDVSAPLKRALKRLSWECVRGEDAPLLPEQSPPEFRAPLELIEDRVAQAIFERCGCGYPWPSIVRHYDLVLLATEKRDLCGPEPRSWQLPPECAPLPETIEPWTPSKARRAWLVRYAELGGEP